MKLLQKTAILTENWQIPVYKLHATMTFFYKSSCFLAIALPSSNSFSSADHFNALHFDIVTSAKFVFLCYSHCFVSFSPQIFHGVWNNNSLFIFSMSTSKIANFSAFSLLFLAGSLSSKTWKYLDQAFFTFVSNFFVTGRS